MTKKTKQLKICSLLFYMFFEVSVCKLFAQNDSVISNYSFINTNASVIEYPEHLHKFKKTISDFRSGKKSEISIVHVGDSHVQAGSYTEPLRLGFQLMYGNAGRGCIFPYQAAGTNGPMDYAFTSNQKWLAKRNCISKIKLPTGLAGHTLHNRSRFATLDFRLRDSLSTEGISEVKIYHASIIDSNYSYLLVSSILSQAIRRTEDLSTPYLSVFKLPKPVKKFSIKVDDQSRGRSSTIFGVIGNNEKKGAIVHSIGVNGAEYQHYLHSDYFTSHLSSLHPDLLIISLGTNEAYNTLLFDPLEFSAKVDSFLTRIQIENPELTIVLTTPPGILQKYRRGNKKFEFVQNKNIVIVNEIIKHQAQKHQCGLWDFYKVMGGFNSMNQWAAAGLTDARRIHFSRKGYTIQGKLLFDALQKELNTLSK